jgi:hypothetical protein
VNLFSKDYINVTFQFSNGNIYEYREKVLMRKKGMCNLIVNSSSLGFIGSRLFPKKAFKLKFNQIKGMRAMPIKLICRENFQENESPEL